MLMDNDKYWSERATVRKYADKEVADSLIREMLELASHAPTTGNMQLYSVIISRDKQKLQQLAPAHFSQPAMVGAPVVLTFCADFNRFVKWCEASGAQPGYDNFQSFMTAVLDTTILAQQFVTIAERRGLGCCYLGTTTYNAPQIAQVLQLPSRVVPVTTISLGYPADTPAVSDRLPVEAFVHSEHYNDADLATVSELYVYKESLAENKAFVEANNKTSLAQVFTDVRYTKANNEYFSKVYRDFIVAAGFTLPD